MSEETEDEKLDRLAKESVDMSWTIPQGSGSVTSDPKEQQKLKDMIEWQKKSSKMVWPVGKPREK